MVRILSDVSLEDRLKLCFVIQGPLHQDRKVHFSGNYIFSHFSKEHIFSFGWATEKEINTQSNKKKERQTKKKKRKSVNQ